MSNISCGVGLICYDGSDFWRPTDESIEKLIGRRSFWSGSSVGWIGVIIDSLFFENGAVVVFEGDLISINIKDGIECDISESRESSTSSPG